MSNSTEIIVSDKGQRNDLFFTIFFIVGVAHRIKKLPELGYLLVFCLLIISNDFKCSVGGYVFGQGLYQVMTYRSKYP